MDGKAYASYGPSAAVLAVPHHLAGRALASMLGIEWLPRAKGLAWVIFVVGVTMPATATGGGACGRGFPSGRDRARDIAANGAVVVGVVRGRCARRGGPNAIGLAAAALLIREYQDLN